MHNSNDHKYHRFERVEGRVFNCVVIMSPKHTDTVAYAESQEMTGRSQFLLFQTKAEKYIVRITIKEIVYEQNALVQ